jgi:PST family polysaccharide transporter
MMFSDFGISTATSKFVAEYSVRDQDKVRHVFFNSLIFVLFSGLILTIVLIFVGPYYFKNNMTYVRFLIPLIFLCPVTSLFDGIYRGLQKFRKLSLISLAVSIVFLPVVYLFVTKLGLAGALISQSAFYFIYLACLALGSGGFGFKIDKRIMLDVGKYSLIIGLGSISYFLYSRINTLIIGHFGLIEEVGYYELVNKFLLIAIVPFTILSQVISPRITRMTARGDYAGVYDKFKKLLLTTIISALSVSVLLYLFLPIVIKFFLHKFYFPEMLFTLDLMLIVLVTQIVAEIVSIGFSQATGDAKLNMYTLVISGLINVPVTVFCVRKFGFVGALYSVVGLRTLTDVIFISIYAKMLSKRVISINKTV